MVSRAAPSNAFGFFNLKKMKIITKRIKRALAAFLKDELLEFIGYNVDNRFLPTERSYGTDEYVQMDVYKMEHIVSFSEIMYSQYKKSPEEFYEEEVNKCKKLFSEQVMSHIYVESKQLISEEFAYGRHIKLSLAIQKPRI